MNRPGSGIFVALVLLSTATLLVGGTMTAVGVTDGATDQPFQQETPANNTTVQHERPSDVSEPGDTDRVQEWLATRLGDRLEDSAIEISQGQYEQAEASLGEEYESRLGQFVEVAGETDTETDDRAGETFEETRDNQTEYANATQSYRETYDSYQGAQETGNTTASRQAARELETISDRITTLNESLQRDYRALENRTDSSLDTTEASIAATTRNISAQQADVRAATFVETNLTVETNGSAVAFTDPMEITGEVETANGTAVANESVDVVVSSRTYRTETDGAGRFTVVYRPVSLSVDAANVSVQYRPDATSPYLGAETATPVAVTQVTPTLAVTGEGPSVGYDDTVETTAAVTVDGRPVPAVPVVSTLGGTDTTGLTDGDGRVTLSQQVPATLPTGERTRTLEHNRSGVAVGPASTTAPVIVTSTVTNLTLTARPNGTAVTARGQLRTADGDAVDGQSVVVAVGETTRTVETNATGWYRVTARNVSADANASIAVTARFDGSGTNLDGSRAETTVAIDGGGESQSVPLLLVVAALVGVLVVGAVLGWFRYTGTDPEETAAVTAGPAPSPEPDAADSDVSQQYLDSAQAALTAGDYQLAVVTAYAAVRGQLARQAELPQSLTHREFLAAYGARQDTETVASFSPLADAYERATFRASVDAATAETAVAVADAMVPEDGDAADS